MADVTFRDTSPRDMVVLLDGNPIGTCNRTQWSGGTTMLYQWRAYLDDGYRVIDPEIAGTHLDGICAPKKSAIKRAVIEAVAEALNATQTARAAPTA